MHTPSEFTPEGANTNARTATRQPRVIEHAGTCIQVEELDVTLAFARKPARLSEVGGAGPTKVFVTETKELCAEEFDALAARLLASCDWLRGKGGSAAGGNLCVEVVAPDRPRLYINPEGSDYARYVARLD
jgi:hypothetical protein